MPTVHTITYSFKSRAGRVYRNVIILNCMGTDFSCLQFIP